MGLGSATAVSGTTSSSFPVPVASLSLSQVKIGFGAVFGVDLNFKLAGEL